MQGVKPRMQLDIHWNGKIVKKQIMQKKEVQCRSKNLARRQLVPNYIIYQSTQQVLDPRMIFCQPFNFQVNFVTSCPFQKLPVVASFHLKRFEHSSRLHKKISTRVDFPEIIDMSPFITGSRNIGKCETKEVMTEPDNKYVLFAVINHIGTLDAGHYTSFIRQHSNLWQDALVLAQ